MSINIKKYTKEQMAKMVEDAQEKADSLSEEAAHLYSRNDELTEELELTEKLLDTAKREKADLKLSLRMLGDENSALKQKNTMLTESINQMNGEAITRENVIANLKADADVLRNKLADTEAALGRANAELGAAEGALGEMNDKIVWCEAYSRTLRRDVNEMQLENIGAIMRADYAEAHPWRNLWEWVKRKLARHE